MSYMVKYLRISSYVRKPFLIYDFATDPIWISLYAKEISFSLFSVYSVIFFIQELQYAMRRAGQNPTDVEVQDMINKIGRTLLNTGL